MLEFLFNPESICLIGASNDPKKIGFAITKNLLESNSKNIQLYLVSKTSSQIGNRKPFSSILEIRKPITLAI